MKTAVGRTGYGSETIFSPKSLSDSSDMKHEELVMFNKSVEETSDPVLMSSIIMQQLERLMSGNEAGITAGFQFMPKVFEEG